MKFGMLQSKIPQAFPLVALLGFLSVRAKEKGLKASILLSSCKGRFSLCGHYLENPKSGDVKHEF